MPKSISKGDFSDVDSAFRRFQSMVESKMDAVGKESVRYAEENGNYQDRSGYLRSRNQYRVSGGKLELFNDADYAAFVEANGFDVIGSAALYAEKKLKEAFR